MDRLRLKAGDLVRYHPVIGGPHDGKTWEVRDVGTLPHGRNVAWLKGKAGCVAAEALSLCGEDQHGPV